MDNDTDKWVFDTFGVDPASYARPGASQASGTGQTADSQASDSQGPGGFFDMIEKAASAVAQGVEMAAGEVAHAVSGAIDEIGNLINLKAPPHPVLGTAQQARADTILAALPKADQDKYNSLLEGAKSDKEKKYLTKGLAAGHSVAELTAFEAKIAGKDEKWMQDNLSLTGNSKGKGVKQQWSMSCNATTVEAVKGELDPLYALQMHEDNPDLTEADDKDGTKRNPKLAADQKALLETKNPDGSQGGIAHDRFGDTNPRGRWNTDLLNNISDVTGVSYTNQKIGTDVTEDAGITSMNTNLAAGTPVPIVIGDGGPKTTFAHYVLVTGSEPGPPRTYTIHDPATGDTVVRSEDDLRAGKLNVAGWNKISAFETPTPTQASVKIKLPSV